MCLFQCIGGRFVCTMLGTVVSVHRNVFGTAVCKMGAHRRVTENRTTSLYYASPRARLKTTESYSKTKMTFCTGRQHRVKVKLKLVFAVKEIKYVAFMLFKY